VKSKTRVALTVLISGLLSAVLVVAACDGGGNSTTTTTGSAPEVTTTTAAAVEVTTTTAAILESTTTTSMLGETTTTGLEGTTTTTEELSTAETRLSNGHIKAMGFIDKVYVKDGKRYISIDYAEYLTGAAADAAAIAAGEIKPGEHVEDDYWIQNDNPQKRVFEVSDSVAITTSTWTTFAWNEIMDHPVTWAQFKSFWSATPPADAIHLHRSPWWIERDGPLVVKIDEQFLP
jgi:formylglycine-generating enzyme required for sulfatase activity